MKKKFLLHLLVTAFVIGTNSCEKEVFDKNHSDCNFEEQEYEVAMTPEEFEAGIMDAFNQMEVQGGTESIALFMDNEGIPSFLEMDPFNASDFKGKKEGPCNLSGKNELTQKQRAGLKQAWEAYQGCKASYTDKQKALYRAIRAKLEKQRTVLKRQLDAKKITPKEFAERMAKLRQQFKEQMKERGDAHRKGMNACYFGYLQHVQKILNKQQYAIWIRCHQAHLPHKKPLDPKKRENKT